MAATHAMHESNYERVPSITADARSGGASTQLEHHGNVHALLTLYLQRTTQPAA